MDYEDEKQLTRVTWLRRALLTCTILGLLATNIPTVTRTAFNAALSGFMSATLGIATVTEAFQSKIAKQDQAMKKHKVVTRKFGNRLATRTKRFTAASVAAIPGETIRLLRIEILAAACSGQLIPDIPFSSLPASAIKLGLSANIYLMSNCGSDQKTELSRLTDLSSKATSPRHQLEPMSSIQMHVT
ncbi:hypothetical protein DWB85_04610 [Seongchinamella sediminis]|uniref:Uncharacterized protein n=1 Tax=Seongchinamella sediminis TaxID=2283635 RepID=A0A3L7E469_9GAMM|nr:hypothetical protein [Seongchinamella sediminis]RLQ23251.1 hypothetical protein DWB85_04610 [Seongchinamella sediminis]